ncbi:hypothetical protein V8F20_012288 [Naviculisporaceae sp. PSN 640]
MAQIQTNGTSTSDKKGITVFSGGTAANSLVDVFNRVIQKRGCQLNYVIPISDNGGSSSELIRVVGGPSVGDIRSRLVRLIPKDGNREMDSLRQLFECRLDNNPHDARMQWLEIVEGRDMLWAFISSAKMELIRSVLNTLNLEIVKRARPGSTYNFARASIGNMFLTGARIFTGSFESAIYLLSMICSIPSNIEVLPAINSNFTHHICAGLADGTTIAGQVAISHPSEPTALADTVALSNTSPTVASSDPKPKSNYLSIDEPEDANLPGSLSTLRRPNITFSKDDEEDLPSRINRLWYINPYGHELKPTTNPKVLKALRSSTAVIYSIGSLYTSIIPSLILRGVGNAISDKEQVKHKILILNGKIDRETGGKSDPMTATDFVEAIARAAAGEEGIAAGGYGKYVSHLVYLEGEGTPVVDVEGLRRLGVVCVRAEGKIREERNRKKTLLYDEEELGRVLEEILDS